MLTFNEFFAKKRPIMEGVAEQMDSLIKGDKNNIDLRAIRLSIMAEYEAINLYERLSEVVKDKSVKKILLDIADEEKTHVGELRHFLKLKDMSHQSREEEGDKEAKEIVDAKRGKK
jgi:rubrerythrin